MKPRHIQESSSTSEKRVISKLKEVLKKIKERETLLKENEISHNQINKEIDEILKLKKNENKWFSLKEGRFLKLRYEDISWFFVLISLTGTVLNVWQNKTCFIFWMISNLFLIFYNVYLKSWSQMFIFCIYWLLAIFGFFIWK